ncbi:MAG: tRNA threonylcarbamoyladenosine dehydratase [Muribaculaceae bacterium]|nr:tRNA threonylcarbamoyladenosine dehydratase [Muribaculaceae bacterium]
MSVTEYNQRTALLLGEEAVTLLAERHVMVAGVGGVGSYAVEMIARSGIGQITIIDADKVAPSNINRQLPALVSTVGEPKTEVMKRRILDINPSCRVNAIEMFLSPENTGEILDSHAPDSVIDAIDSVSPKVALIEQCYRRKLMLISSMGAGGRIDPTQVKYADISDTYHDGLARAVRQRLKQRGITHGIKTVFSSEQPRRHALIHTDEMQCKVSSFGTVAWLPATFGMMLAAYTINRLTGQL